jgi:putative ABC transport system substrate-binding protein
MKLAALLLALALQPLAAAAQPRIGVLNFTQMTDNVKREMLLALREEGYVDGNNIRVEWRGADGSTDRARELAKELLALRVDIIVAMLTPAVQAASEATKTIPIVMAPSGAPQLFVKSLARPGGNVTGVGGYGAELSGKRIELIQELIPGIKRIGLLTNSADPFARSFVAESQAAAKKAGVELHIADVLRPEDVDAAYAKLKKAGAGAVIVQGVLTGPAWQAAPLAVRHGLPSVSITRPWAESGGLVYHAGSSAETYRRAASYVKRILGGAKPAELPVERPTRIELVINLKTAKALGLTIPRELLVRADRVID